MFCPFARRHTCSGSGLLTFSVFREEAREAVMWTLGEDSS